MAGWHRSLPPVPKALPPSPCPTVSLLRSRDEVRLHSVAPRQGVCGSTRKGNLVISGRLEVGAVLGEGALKCGGSTGNRDFFCSISVL